jgi:hypothetical protein
VGWFEAVGTDATPPTLAELLAAWNGPENVAVRDAVRPPRGPVRHVGASTDVRSAPRAVHHPDGTLSLGPHEPDGS